MKKITFKKFITIYSIALAALMACFLFYVVDSLLKYENNQLDNYMDNLIANLKDADKDCPVKGLSEVKKSPFDTADATAIDGLAFLAANGALSYQLSPTSTDAANPVFDVYEGGNAIMRVKLASKKNTTRLGLLTFDIWENKEIEILKKDGIFNYTISVPNNYNVEVNGKKLTESEYDEPERYAGLSALAKQMDLAYQVNYIVKGLAGKPEVKITDKKGEPVQYEAQGTTLSIDVPCEKIADEATAKTKINNYPDVQALARQWSLYLSNDLTGARNGFETIKQYLVEGTYLYQYAFNWCTSVDRTFVSMHGFEKEKFSEEKVCNFEIYNDKEFSCDVFLQKNMLVHAKPLADKMAERMHFVYIDDTDDGTANPQWKLVSMKAVTEK